ncbi:MAG: D-alanyl-D-alanine carboxypeptidase [Rickettsiales bacterium]|jgi:D-alanyl-D-alanine carboxypeptidase|nr:D-alanyl-D-alanine carboxypeptidase [Rickettsiales bacterium]
MDKFLKNISDAAKSRTERRVVVENRSTSRLSRSCGDLFFAANRRYGPILKSVALFFCLIGAASAAPKAVLVADMDSGVVLYQEGASDLNYPASLTKLMTLYLTFDAIEHGRLSEDQNLIVSQRAANQPAMKLGLKPGEKIKVSAAIKALIIRSANDVATVLSENLKGDEGDFSETMTRTASEIGLKQTNFENASGLPNDDQISSARDIALLSIAIYQHFPQYFHYFDARNFSHNGQTYETHNNMLKTYPGANGMKTGFTNKARYNIAVSAKRNGSQLVGIVLGAANSAERASAGAKLLDYGFAVKSGGKPGDFSMFRPSPSRMSYYDDDDDSDESNYESYGRSSPRSVTQTRNEFADAGRTDIKTSSGKGGAGVQFGAFSSRASAQSQSDKVKRLFGASPTIEPYNNLYRVRVYGLSESSASQMKSKADAAGVPSFTFH